MNTTAIILAIIIAAVINLIVIALVARKILNSIKELEKSNLNYSLENLLQSKYNTWHLLMWYKNGLEKEERFEECKEVQGWMDEIDKTIKSVGVKLT